MKQDPDHARYLEEFHENYKSLNQRANLASYFLSQSHKVLEATCPAHDFKKVLELGAGPIPHLSYVQQDYEDYWVTDLNCSKETVQLYSGNNRVHVKNEDATKLTFADGTFDRIIAAHLLEHLPNPNEVLREWIRVLKPGGILSLVLPCDPGLLWEFGRNFGPRRRALALGIDYDYWMAREHINSIQNLIAFLRYYFRDAPVKKLWYPFLLPNPNLNLFYISHIRKQ